MDLNDLLKQNSYIINDIKYKILKTKEKQNSIVLYLDNDEKLTISIESYFKYKLTTYKGLDDNTYNLLKKEEILFVSYLNCLRKLSIKDYSIKQIKDYLLDKRKLNTNQIDCIIDKLTNYGLLNDEKYTIARINYLNNQLLSSKQIKYKLINEGISNELIEKYVIINNEDEYNKAFKLGNKYLNSIRNKSTNAIKKTILSKIIANGYTYDCANTVISNIKIINKEENLLLAKEFDKVVAKYSKKYEGYDLKNHIYSYLLNKGFKSSDIKKQMEEYYG